MGFSRNPEGDGSHLGDFKLKIWGTSNFACRQRKGKKLKDDLILGY